MAFVDILSGGRVVLGLGSGYRPYEFEGFGRDFDSRRDVQEEAIDLILELLHKRRTRHEVPHFHSVIEGDYEIFPVSQQEPHPPLFMAGATDRSLGYAARHGFGLMLSTLPSAETLAEQIGLYKGHLKDAPAPLDRNPAFGKVDIARWVYVADTDAAAKRDTSRASSATSATSWARAPRATSATSRRRTGWTASPTTTWPPPPCCTARPTTVIAKLRELRHKTGLSSLLLHYPPYYGHDNAMRSLRLFAEKVMPEFRPPASRSGGGLANDLRPAREAVDGRDQAALERGCGGETATRRPGSRRPSMASRPAKMRAMPASAVAVTASPRSSEPSRSATIGMSRVTSMTLVAPAVVSTRK